MKMLFIMLAISLVFQSCASLRLTSSEREEIHERKLDLIAVRQQRF